MKTTNKALAVIFVIAMVVSMLCACSAATPTTAPAQNTEAPTVAPTAAPTATTNSAPTTLVFYGLNDVNMPDLFTKFEQDNNCKIESIYQGSDVFKQAFMVAKNGGQQMDVGILNGQDVRSYANQGLLMDLTNDATYMDRFEPSSAGQFVIGGKLYALPSATIWNMVLFYNKDIFAANNLQPPVTYADVVADAKVFQAKGVSGIAVGAANMYDLTNWYFVNFFQASGNKGLERTIDTLEGKAKFTDQDYVDAFSYIAQYAKDGLFQPGFLGADSTGRIAAFVSGKTAMYFGGNWDIGALVSAGFSLDKIGALNWPQMKDGVQRQVSGTAAGFATCIYTSCKPENKALALKLIDYLTSDDINLKINQKLGTFLSTNKNVTIPGIDPLNQQIQKDLVPNIVTFLDWYWPPEVTKAFAQELQAVMAQQDTPEVATQKIQKVFDDLVASGYDYNAVK